jgi:FkbM family methyltransferase
MFLDLRADMPSIKRALAMAFPDGTPVPVLAGPLRGKWWLAGAAPGPSKGLSVVLNRSEPGQLREADRLAFRGSVCFDIGAHAGLYSLLFSGRAKRVFAFEPFPRNLAWLVRTLSVNKAANVQVVPWALSGATGPTRFSAGEHNSEGRLDPRGDLAVFAMACDEFCAFEKVRPDLMKIDVEGAEAEVLRGASETLRAAKPALLLSTHGDEAKEECFRILSGLGYGAPRPLDKGNLADAAEFAVTAP